VAKAKTEKPKIESEPAAWALLCKRPKLWRFLWAYEAAKANLDECCAGAGLTRDEFLFVRAAAFRYERFG